MVRKDACTSVHMIPNTCRLIDFDRSIAQREFYKHSTKTEGKIELWVIWAFNWSISQNHEADIQQSQIHPIRIFASKRQKVLPLPTKPCDHFNCNVLFIIPHALLLVFLTISIILHFSCSSVCHDMWDWWILLESHRSRLRSNGFGRLRSNGNDSMWLWRSSLSYLDSGLGWSDRKKRATN